MLLETEFPEQESQSKRYLMGQNSAAFWGTIPNRRRFLRVFHQSIIPVAGTVRGGEIFLLASAFNLFKYHSQTVRWKTLN
jgi:hypothetical protein